MKKFLPFKFVALISSFLNSSKLSHGFKFRAAFLMISNSFLYSSGAIFGEYIASTFAFISGARELS